MIVESYRTFRLGVKSLMLHKLRSALTTLGLLIGVAAVVAMLAIGEGASYEAQQRIKAMGSTNILISSKKPPAEEGASNSSHFSVTYYGLTYNDYHRIKATLAHHLEDVVPVRHTDKEIRVGDKWFNGVLLGTTPTYLRVMGMEQGEGRWISEADNRGKANVAILGATVAETLFQHENPMGKTIKASGERFEVVGILDKLGRRSGSIGRSVDDCIYIPIETSKNWFGEINQVAGTNNREGVQLHEIKVQVNSEDKVLDAARVIRAMLKTNHEEDDYEVKVPLELLREAEATKRQFQLLLFSIASISLIVGGIGIMNVMLATVTERTREIGIRRALGARKRNIISQFLCETVVLSGFGGLLGIIVGVLTPIAADYLSADTHAIVKLEHPVLAFCISALVGVCAGLYPAWRAANMDPVEALRHE